MREGAEDPVNILTGPVCFAVLMKWQHPIDNM